ncbi:MAG: hypothetical protein J6W96_00270, partial [Alphaproteobacteria bacterium]|nr:hypothetical protein [Alphaproteobacteria bacterium]
MTQELEQNRIYLNTISPKQRTNLLETYSDYVSLVCKMEAMLKQNSLQEFANLSGSRIYKIEGLSNVIIRPVSNKEKEIYNNFITHNFSDLGEHN